jgi:2'-5' RNA ligase
MLLTNNFAINKAAKMYNTNAHCMYYLAIVCPDELNKKILSFKLWMQEKFDCKVALKSPAHITLIPPFWFAAEKEDILLQALHGFKSSADAIKIELNNFDHFSNRVIFIDIKPNDHLARVRQEAEDHFFNKLGMIIQKETRLFAPHITIANRDLKPGDFNMAWEHFAHKKFEESFSVNKVSMLKLNEGKWHVIAEKNWVP